MEVSASVCLCGQRAGAARYDTIRDASQSALSTARYQLLNSGKTENKLLCSLKKRICSQVSVGKQSGESVESVLKKKRNVVVGRICREGRL